MRHRQSLSTAWALVVLFVASAFASPAVSTATEFGPVVECPTTVTLQSLIGLSHRYARAGRECYGSADLQFVAFRATPEGLGGTTSYQVEPAWLDSALTFGNGLMLTNEQNEVTYSSPWLDASVPPDLHEAFASLEGQWVEVSGHFDDPAAASCHATWGDPEWTPTPAEIIESCRNRFVLTSIEAVDSPCPDTASWSKLVATPEHLRALCFGAMSLRFEARGGPVTSSFGVDVPFEGSWLLHDVAGTDETAQTLEAFGPSASGLHVPPGASGEDIGGDVLWRISAHVDDPRAAECRPTAGGIVIDGAQYEWDPDEAIAFCRNHLVIDDAVWIRPAAAEPVPSASAQPAAAGPPVSDRPSMPPASGDAAAPPQTARAVTPAADSPAASTTPSLTPLFALLAVIAASITVLAKRLRRT